MKNEVIIAKDELYESLMKYHEVVGASVRHNNRGWYIVILLSRFSNKVLNRIPNKYKGNPVTHEVIGEVTAL